MYSNTKKFVFITLSSYASIYLSFQSIKSLFTTTANLYFIIAKCIPMSCILYFIRQCCNFCFKPLCLFLRKLKHLSYIPKYLPFLILFIHFSSFVFPSDIIFSFSLKNGPTWSTDLLVISLVIVFCLCFLVNLKYLYFTFFLDAYIFLD